MRRWSESKKRRGVPLTPLIDVVFLLLIFFVMAGRFAEEARLVLSDTPAEAAEQQTPAPMMMVEVTKDGSMRLLGDDIAAAELAARLPEEATVVLRLAPDMALEIMVGLIDTLKREGVERLSYWPEPEA